MSLPDLTALFDRFAGKQISVIETSDSVFSRVDLDENDATIAELRNIAEQSGFWLRIKLPGGREGNCEYRADRVTVLVDKDDSGVWRIGNKFTLG